MTKTKKRVPPALRDHLRAISRRGVEARRAKAAATVPPATWPLDDLPTTVQDWQALGAWAARAMVEGAITHQVAKELAGLVRASLAAFRVSEMAHRVQEMESLVYRLLAREKARSGGQNLPDDPIIDAAIADLKEKE